MALSFLGPILGIGKAVLSGQGKGSVVNTALETAGGFFEASAREKRMELEIELEQVRNTGEVAKIQARDGSWFIRAARPALLWVAVGAAFYHFILFPLIDGLAMKVGYELVDLDWQELSLLLTLALGMSGIRAAEKMKGVSREKMS